MATICVVDDNTMIRESVTATLTRADHQVTPLTSASAALSELQSTRYDLVLTDLKMPGMDGLELIRALRQRKCDAPVMVMTAHGTVGTAVEAMKLGALDFIQKPFDGEGLRIRVERALRHQQLQLENEALKTSLRDIRKQREMIGNSLAMRAVHNQISQFAASDATVLISGESGTGKELAAAAIYEGSLRRDRAMLCLNCAALASTLLESELFGHERGAFTGADRLRKGRFELAHGGTLLLDEISEMALPLQAKLLRVLQEGEFDRVGGSTPIHVNVRVIATTNRVLEERVEKKRFREDLFYRLNVLPLRLPSLRERREDIPELVSHFLARFTGRESTAKRMDDAAIDLLMNFQWPGNVRELENLCQRAVATVESDVIRASDVEPWLAGEKPSGDPFVELRVGRMLEDMERKLIERTLRQYGGHRAKSAKALGMGVRTLGLKLKQWREEGMAERAMCS